MNKRSKHLLFGFSLIALLLLDVTPEVSFPISLVPEAAAIIGRPITPLSVAGVARRTTRRRAVAYTATASTAAVTTSQAAAPPSSQPAHAPAGAPPIGSIVTTLPQGCVESPQGGIEYYNCGGVYYRPAFQGNNLVYVVQNP